MTNSYVGPSTAGVFAAPKDEVRFLTGDTEQDAYTLSDEEVTYWLVFEGGNVKRAAADVLEKRATAYETTGAASQSVVIGPFQSKRASGTEVAASMRLLAEQYRAGTLSGTAVIPAGLDDDCWDDPATFHEGMNDFPGTGLAGRRSTGYGLRYW